jgi:hypothetical protein
MPDSSIHELGDEHAALRATLAFLCEEIAEAEESRWCRRRPAEGVGHLHSLREQESECRRQLAEIARALEGVPAATLDGIMAKAAALGTGAADRSIRLRRTAERVLPDLAES